MTTTYINARLINPATRTDALGSLTVANGQITAIDGPQVGTIVDLDGACLAPGIVDIGVKICEPGERHKESYASAGAAAAAGGVTTIVTRPDTDPAIDTPEVLEFIAKRAEKDSPVKVHPMAALTKGRAGSEMVEIGFSARRRRSSVHRLRSRHHQHQSLSTRIDLRTITWRTGHRPRARANPEQRRLCDKRQIRLVAGASGCLTYGRAYGP
jgi:adenine deaminase